MSRKRIAVIFGGRSGEHEVSVESARNIINAFDKDRFAAHAVGIDKKGQWHVAEQIDKLLAPSQTSGEYQVSPDSSVVIPTAEEHRLKLLSAENGDTVAEFDLAFPIAHGSFGEDGSLQGCLRMLDAPFVGAGVTGSAVGMDKDIMKRLFRHAGLAVPRFVVIRRRDRSDTSFDVLQCNLGTPFFVKPCNLGSSVGISKVATPEAFDRAMEEAFAYDTKVIVEEAIQGREVECAVLGNDQPEASAVGEIRVKNDFYSYEAKYLDDNAAEILIPAPLDDVLTRKVQEMSIAAFEATECAGLARVDCFVTKEGEVLLNEINTLPGFTRISMYPKLWEHSGLPYSELLEKLVELGEELHSAQRSLRRAHAE
ncbi:MAG: D-alanine--D-alanine ligase [Candidatus Sumerlaeota bacterium]